LGRTGVRVSELFLGSMTFGEQGGVGAPLAECRRMLDAYADAGGNVVDTAINYRGGASEEILGELLAGRRDRFVLATKYTVSRDGTDPNAAGNHRKNLVGSLETSLRRLRTDYLDIYWCTCGTGTRRSRRRCGRWTTSSGPGRFCTSESPTRRPG
jgi:aryl-alcohol dehydrogenase-like predicted oxidoreductase